MNSKKKVLIVDDETSLRNALQIKLTAEGFECLMAEDGQEALEVAFHKHPDLILLDIMMPKMDGITALGQLRNDEWGKSVPVIMLTNSDDTKKVSEALSFGSFNYLVKSNWSLEDMVARVRSLI